MTELSTHSKVSIANVSRRGLLKGVAATGGLVLAAQFPTVKGALASYPTGGDAMPNGVVNNPKVFISIGGDGTVSIVAARAEMGNGAARTALPMMVADELDADWARVRVVQSPGDERTYGNQDTDGSRSVRHWIQPMRHCGAAARLMLEQAAAATWKVDIGEVQAQLHEVVHKPTNRKLGYGQLAAAAAGLPVPSADKVKLKDASAFRYIGKGNVRIADIVDITTGKAIYGQDVMVPGMKYAVIARPPVVGGKVASVDSSAAMKVPGVEKIVTLPGTPAPYKFGQLGGVAVIAKNTWAAIKGREALKITWDNGPNATHDSKAYRAQLEAAVKKPGKVERNVGDADKALASAAKVITAEYYAPHLHHATMEPPAAVARMSHGKWEVWAPVQSPGQARDDIAAAIGVAPAEMTVQPTLLGGGFGRKSKCDFAIEAALLSKDLGGTPVKVVWTREDDVRHGFYHTVTAERFEAGLDASNKVIAWRHRSAAPTILSTFAPGQNHPFDIELGMGWVDTPFDVPNIRMESGEAQNHVRIGWFRSVNNVAHAWSIQSFVAEMAQPARQGPQGLPARADRSGADHRPAQAGDHAVVELRRAVRDLPHRYGAAAARHRACRQGGGLGQAVAEGAGARHCRAPQLRHLRCHGRACGGRRQGPHHHPARRHGDRLRLLRASRTGSLADRRRRRDGVDARQVWRDDAQERSRRAVELQRLPARAHRRVAARNAHPHRAERSRCAAERGG